jgi:predicted DNA-binding transcriptional regulator YafY
VTFAYQSYRHDEASVCELEPYCIRQYDQRWYAVGRSPQYAYLKPFALDRIVGKPELTKAIFENPDFKPEQFFQHIYGMHTEPVEQARAVQLQFSALQARYFLSRPFHSYHDLEELADGSIRVRMKVCITIELIRKLAGYGCEAEVLAPESLRETMRAFFEQGAGRYGG